MQIDARLARLKAGTVDAMLNPNERAAAVARYAEVHAPTVAAFPDAMSPSDYQHALETIQNPRHQCFIACGLPGDDDI